MNDSSHSGAACTKAMTVVQFVMLCAGGGLKLSGGQAAVMVVVVVVLLAVVVVVRGALKNVVGKFKRVGVVGGSEK